MVHPTIQYNTMRYNPKCLCTDFDQDNTVQPTLSFYEKLI